MFKFIINLVLLAVLLSCNINSKRIEQKEVEDFMFSFFSSREKLILVDSSQEQLIVQQLEKYYDTPDSANHLINNLLAYKRNNEKAIGKVIFKESRIVSMEIDSKAFIIQGNEAKFNISMHYKQMLIDVGTNNQPIYVSPEGYRTYAVRVVLDKNNQYLILSAQLVPSKIANDY